MAWKFWSPSVIVSVALWACALVSGAQTGSDVPRIDRKIILLPEQLVQEQWPVMRGFIHLPADIKQIEPGQCVRFAITASNEGSDKLLRDAKFSFEISFLDKTQSFDMESIQLLKETTAITHESLLKSLQSVKAAKSLMLTTYMASSKAGWCAPSDIQDGTATVKGAATMADGKTVAFDARSIPVKTFETARRHLAFKGADGFEQWAVQYHHAPDPAQLLPALRIIAVDEKLRDMTNAIAFFGAALRANKPAAEELIRKLSTEKRWVRLYSVVVLNQAGYSTESLVSDFTDQDKSLLQGIHLPNACDTTPGADIGERQDMLWSIFFATGSFEPVRTIALELGWGDDYAALKRARDAGEHQEWTDSAGRAVGYAAAGWSIRSLAQQDTLIDDYVEALKAAPDTPPAVKKELENLYTNPAFRITPPK